MKKENDNNIFHSANLTINSQLGKVSSKTGVVSLGLVNMRVLITLLESQSQVLSRSDLFDQVWQNQIVNDDVLTRCISDLRTQLGKLCDGQTLIETLPKRGYRWLPEVNNEHIERTDDPINNNKDNSRRWTQLKSWLVAGLLFISLISLLAFWQSSKNFDPTIVRVALLPIQISQPEQRTIADELDDLLRATLLSTKKLRFLARSVVTNNSKNPFPYLSREFGTQWIIEGHIRKQQDKFRISLSIIDARTAMVTYTLVEDIESAGLELITKRFVDELNSMLK